MEDNNSDTPSVTDLKDNDQNQKEEEQHVGPANDLNDENAETLHSHESIHEGDNENGEDEQIEGNEDDNLFTGEVSEGETVEKEEHLEPEIVSEEDSESSGDGAASGTKDDAKADSETPETGAEDGTAAAGDEVAPPGDVESTPPGEAEPEPTGEAKPEPTGEAKPEPTGEPEPALTGEAEPAPAVEGEPAVDDEAAPVVDGESAPVVDGESEVENVEAVKTDKDEKEEDIRDAARYSRRKRKSIFKEIKPQYELDTDSIPEVTGDFKALLPPDFFERNMFDFSGFEVEDKEEEEVVTEEEEEEYIPIDRTPYYEKYHNLFKQLAIAKLKNNFMQKRLAEFFKKRKMDHVLRESTSKVDTEAKYGYKLDALGNLLDVDTNQRQVINTELNSLKELRNQKCEEISKMFIAMQEREKEIGYGLIFTKTGNEIPDKYVERLIKRQKNQQDTIADMRLVYIRIKDRVIEKQNILKNLDCVGKNLYLIDYEQLKMSNRGYADKIEERESELTILRQKCQNSIQILAHIREKSAAIELNIMNINGDILSLNETTLMTRELLNNIKQERDFYRSQANKLAEESGLLTRPTLLRDMEHSLDQLHFVKERLKTLQEESKEKAEQIRAIRKKIETFVDTGVDKKKRLYKMVANPTKKPIVLKGRPSLILPTLPNNAFDHLKNYNHKSFKKY